MRRGVTLLELLLALVLLLALGAIALPAMFETSEHAKLQQAAEAIEEQLLLARAHAMLEGMSIEVRYDRATNRLTVCDASSVDEPEASASESQSDAAPSLSMIKRDWAELMLPAAVTLTVNPPRGDPASEGAAVAPGAADAAAPAFSAWRLEDDVEDEESPVTLTVFMPDGSAPVAKPIWLASSEGRVMRIEVGRWTGIPRIEREPVLEQEEPVQEEDEALKEEPSEDTGSAGSPAEDNPPAPDPSTSPDKDTEEDDETKDEGNNINDDEEADDPSRGEP